VGGGGGGGGAPADDAPIQHARGGSKDAAGEKLRGRAGRRIGFAERERQHNERKQERHMQRIDPESAARSRGINAMRAVHGEEQALNAMRPHKGDHESKAERRERRASVKALKALEGGGDGGGGGGGHLKEHESKEERRERRASVKAMKLEQQGDETRPPRHANEAW